MSEEMEWNTEEEKAKYRKKVRAKNGKIAIRDARRKAEMHELEGDRYDRLSGEDWREAVANGGRDDLLKEGFFCTYGAAERDMRVAASIVYKMTGQLTMMHWHAKGEECVEAVYGNKEGVSEGEGEGEMERLKAGCEWIGSGK